MTRPDRVIPRFLAVSIAAPAVITVIGVAAQLALLPQVPDPVATHWGTSGVDGVAPAWTVPLMTALLGFGLPLLLALTTLPGLRQGDRGPTYRLLGSTATAVSTLIALVTTVSLVIQRGLADAADAPDIAPWLLVAIPVALAAGAVAWFVQPAQHRHTADAEPAEALPLAADEHAVWIASTSVAPVGGWLIGGAVLVLLAGTVAAWVAEPLDPVAWVLSIVTVVLLVALLTTLVFRVRVDEHGLTVVSPIGFPRFRVPLSDIRAVRVVPVNPMGEFGGWGLRWAPPRFGVVLRSGPAIEIDRADGRRQFVVTVDDAETGARLLQALVERAEEANR